MKLILPHFKIAFIGALLFSSICYPVIAQEADSPEVGLIEEELFEFDLEDLLNLELTTGSFLDLDLKSSPVSMTIITKEMLASSGARHLSEALEIYVPGFQYMYNKWNGIIWGMRGVAPNRNTKFIFLVNGHKMNHESRDGAMSELDLGMLGDIERIEVLRGPAGLVYGSGSIAGVVNIVTREYNQDVISINTSFRTWDLATKGYQIEGNVNKEINDETSVAVSVGYRESEGAGTERSRVYGQGSWPYPGWLSSDAVPANGVPTASSAHSTPGNYKASVDLKWKDLRIYSRATHQVTNAGSMFVTDIWPEVFGAPDSTAPSRMFDGNIISYDDPFYSQIETWNTNRRQYVFDNLTTQLSYNVALGENDLKFNAGMDNASNKILREESKAYSSIGGEERNTFKEETFGENRYNIGAMYHLKSVNRLQAAIGYQFRLFDVGNDMSGYNSQAEKGTHPIVTDVMYTNHAIFAEGLYEINDMLKVNAGARYDAHSRTIQHGGVFSPKIALIAALSDKHIVKLIYQTSANNGSVDNYEFNRNHYKDDGTVSTGSEYRYEKPTQKPGVGSDVLPPVSADLLRELRPEKARSFELSSVHELSKGFIVAPSISYNTIKDLFVWNQTFFREENGGSYNSINIDLEAKYSSEKITFGINHTLQKMVNSNKDEALTFDMPIFDGYDSTIQNGITYYSPHDSGNDTTISLYPIQTIAPDGSNFASLATNVTKLYVDLKPNKWLTFSSNARIFYGLPGRKSIHTNGFNDLGITEKAIIKWNAAVHVKASENLKISVLLYDILGNTSNPIHSVRWQQYGTTDQTDLFSMDFMSMGLNLEYKF